MNEDAQLRGIHARGKESKDDNESDSLLLNASQMTHDFLLFQDTTDLSTQSTNSYGLMIQNSSKLGHQSLLHSAFVPSIPFWPETIPKPIGKKAYTCRSSSQKQALKDALGTAFSSRPCTPSMSESNWMLSSPIEVDKKLVGASSNFHICFICRTTETPLWRRSLIGKKMVCNACGMCRGISYSRITRKVPDEEKETTDGTILSSG